jgi:hypothetical protein
MAGLAALVHLLLTFFLHRRDVFAAIHPVTRTPCPARATDLEAAVTAHVVGSRARPATLRFLIGDTEDERRGHFRLGAYTLDVDDTVKWACWDLDGPGHKAALADPTRALVRLRHRHKEAGLDVLSERSGSGDGWHAWLFFDEPIAAALVRRALLPLAIVDEPLSKGGVADVRRGQGLELFPKQDRLKQKHGERGFGNLVWLPGWHGAKPGGNQFYDVDDDGVATLVISPTIPITSAGRINALATSRASVAEPMPGLKHSSKPPSTSPMSQHAPKAAAAAGDSARLCDALANAIHRHAAVQTPGAGRVRINAFWRQGDGANVSVDLNRGVWRDHKTGDGGGVREFARQLGMTLPEFLTAYGSAAAPRPTLVDKERPPLLAADEIAATWEKLVSASTMSCGECRGCWYGEPCASLRRPAERVWLNDVRGIPHEVVIDSGVAALNERTSTAFPQRARWWTRAKASQGALVVPLRGALTNTVRNLVLRPFSPTDPKQKSFFLPGTKMRGEQREPLGYGFAGAVGRATRVLITEGLVDTLVLEAAFRLDPQTVVVGVVSASEFKVWTHFLVDTQATVLAFVPHLDGDNRGDAYGTGQDAVVKAVAYLRAAERRAFRFSWDTVHAELIRQGIADAVKSVRDIGDVAKLAAANRIAWTDVASVVSRGVEVAHG